MELPARSAPSRPPSATPAALALDALEQATQSGTWLLSLDGAPQLWWSPGTRRLLEWPEDAPLPDLDQAIGMYRPASQQQLQQALERLQREGGCFELELELLTGLGRPLFVRATGHAEGPLGAPRRITGTVYNIDRRRRAEQRALELGSRLAEFEERWRLATEGSGLGVWDWDAQTNTVFFSHQWKAMLGYTDEEIGNSLDEWDRRVHPEDREQVYRDLNAHLEGRTAEYRNEHRVLCKSGRYKWVLDRGQVMSRTVDGKPLRVVGTHTDIDRQKFLEDVAAQVGTRYQGIFNSTYQFIGLLTPEGTLLEANQTALQFGGLQPEEVIGKPFWDCRWWQTGEATRQRLQASIARAAAGEIVQYQVEVRGAGETTAIIDFSLKPVRDEHGSVVMIVPEGRDITAQVQAQAALAERDRLFRATFDHAPIGTAIVGLTGEWLEVNEALCQILGYTREALRQRRFQDLTHPDDLDADLQQVQALLRGEGDCYRMVKRYLHGRGHVVHAQLDVTLVRGPDGQPACFLSQIQDVSPQRQAAEALQQEKELAQITLAAIGDGVIRTDLWGRITFINEAALRLLKCLGSDVLGQPFDEWVQLVSERDGAALDSPVRRVLREGLPTGLPAMAALVLRDGSRLSVEDSCTPMRNTKGQLVGCVFVFHDVSATRQLSQQLLYQASHDALTGLPNRREFEAELDSTRASASARGGEHFLLLMDLDHFKQINDSHGHQAGDRVLRELAERLRAQLRAADLLARLGGDEFGVILRNCPASEALRIARQLIQTVTGYAFEHEGQRHPLGLSVGLARFEPGVAVSALLNRADSACYRAKRDGRQRAVLFGDDHSVTAAV
ncbi:MAG TPA: PAS domain S-box protein [Nevskiaceae bacterium]|nr:PAS domain S-box protein [Nevskiaceae bacterium]